MITGPSPRYSNTYVRDLVAVHQPQHSISTKRCKGMYRVSQSIPIFLQHSSRILALEQRQHIYIVVIEPKRPGRLLFGEGSLGFPTPHIKVEVEQDHPEVQNIVDIEIIALGHGFLIPQ